MEIFDSLSGLNKVIGALYSVLEQADSEKTAKNKADVIRTAKFEAFVENIRSKISTAPEHLPPAKAVKPTDAEPLAGGPMGGLGGPMGGPGGPMGGPGGPMGGPGGPMGGPGGPMGGPGGPMGGPGGPIKAEKKANGIIPLVFGVTEMNSCLEIINRIFTEDIRFKLSDSDIDFDIPDSIGEKISTFKTIIGRLKEDQVYSVIFVFALLMALAADKSDYENRLSAICDTAVLLGISDEEMSDIVQAVKFVYHDIKSADIKTQRCKKVFEKLIPSEE